MAGLPCSRGGRLALEGCGRSACWLPRGLSPAQPFPPLPQFRRHLWYHCAPPGVTSQTPPKDTRDFAQQPIAPKCPVSAAGVTAVLRDHPHVRRARAMAVLHGAQPLPAVPRAMEHAVGCGTCLGMLDRAWGSGSSAGVATTAPACSSDQRAAWMQHCTGHARSPLLTV